MRRTVLPLTTATAIVAAISCGDIPPVSPRIGPGRAALSLAPTFAAVPPGGPVIPLSSVRAILTNSSGNSVEFSAPFTGDSAVLDIQVGITGASTDFDLDLAALDQSGVVAYSSRQRITLFPGENAPPQVPPLVYDGPDAGVTTLTITGGLREMAVLATTTLSVTGTNSLGAGVPSIRVGWTSSDTVIARVNDQGVVTAGRSQGIATITAMTATGVSASVQVLVNAPVDHIAIEPTPVTVARGGMATVAAMLSDVTGRPISNRMVEWSSSDETVVTVSAAGVVTGNRIGSAIITALAEGKTATAPVNVVSAVQAIRFETSVLDFTALGQRLPLGVILVPHPGLSVEGLEPVITGGSPQVATYNDGVVTSIANGTTRFTATIDGLSASIDVRVEQVAAQLIITVQSPVFAGDFLEPNAHYADAEGNEMGFVQQSDTAGFIEWSWTTSPSEGVMHADGEGALRADGPGIVFLTGTFRRLSGTVVFQVLPDPAVGFSKSKATPREIPRPSP